MPRPVESISGAAFSFSFLTIFDSVNDIAAHCTYCLIDTYRNSLMQMSKLQPPEISGLTPRPRLLSLLNHQKEKKLFCFMGMPATGKKTLAAQYVQQCGLPTLWINLERWDSEPDQFGYWLVQSLETILDARAFAELAESLKAIHITTPSGRYDRQWARLIANGLPDQTMVVITDMENIPTRSPIFRILKDLLTLTKNSVKLIFCTCSPPGLPIHEMAMNRSALILTTADLL